MFLSFAQVASGMAGNAGQVYSKGAGVMHARLGAQVIPRVATRGLNTQIFSRDILMLKYLSVQPNRQALGTLPTFIRSDTGI